MDSVDVTLANGELMSVRINFLTLYMITESDIDRLQKKLKKDPENSTLNMSLAAELIYIILRSNGKKVDKEDALALVPADPDEILGLVRGFQREVEKLKKKEDSKNQLKKLNQ